MSKNVKRVSSFLNKQFDFILCITVLLLLALGIIMVLSASAPSALSVTGNSYTYVGKQLFFACIGLGVMFFISKVDYRFYKKNYKYVYILSVFVLLLVLVPGLGHSVKGATRWIKLGGFGSFQPSELTKIGLIVFYASFITDNKKNVKTIRFLLTSFALLIPPIAILYFVQNHLSASLIICVIVAVMIFVSGSRIRYFIIGGVFIASALTGYLGIQQLSGKENFRLDRISTFFNPWADAQGTGYQTVQSLYAIGSGGMFGAGLGNSKQKYLYIPEPHNDFIFSILAEELGFLGCCLVMILFGIFVWRGILIAVQCTDLFGILLAVGTTTQIAFQAIMNIAVVTASIPTTGISLPFFSYGGTALMLLLANVGILLNISRSNSKV